MNKESSISLQKDVVGMVLAGGTSRRFGGGDKGLRLLGGVPLVDRVIERARLQTPNLILNANGPQKRFIKTGLDIVPDVIKGGLGPLAGVLTGMEWAKTHISEARFIMTYAIDAPFFPPDLVQRLYTQILSCDVDIAMASSNGQNHPVFAVWSISLLEQLRHAVEHEGVRKVMAWADQNTTTIVGFDADRFDPFFNINTQQDLNEAETLLKNAFDDQL